MHLSSISFACWVLRKVKNLPKSLRLSQVSRDNILGQHPDVYQSESSTRKRNLKIEMLRLDSFRPREKTESSKVRNLKQPCEVSSEMENREHILELRQEHLNACWPS